MRLDKTQDSVRPPHVAPDAPKFPQVGMWANPFAYIVVALSGEGNDIMSKLPNRGPWGQLAFVSLLVCAVTDVAALSLWTAGVWRELQEHRRGRGRAEKGA